MLLNPPLFANILKCLALELRLGAEVEQQADFMGRGLQVVKQLGLVFIGQILSSFQFDNDGVGDE